MKGKQILELNQDTMLEALQDYLQRRSRETVIISRVCALDGNGYRYDKFNLRIELRWCNKAEAVEEGLKRE